jgi:ATP-dependent exoDNAse (exonuclease V) beta subunit
LAALPLTELVENLIHIFSLGRLPTEIAYLQGFQDAVMEFMTHEKSDIASFLEWWEDNKHKKSIQVAGGVEAAQIITIHKSKGLQFKYVIIPFLDWELNHLHLKSPVLWCKSDHFLFEGAGYVPLKYTSKLEETVFRDYYTEERKRIYLDNLNLLYVAFTRAEEGLIAYAPLTKSSSLSHVGQLVRKAIEATPQLLQHWSEDNKWYQQGEPLTPHQTVMDSDPLILHHYAVTPWRERIYVSARGKEFFEPVSGQRKKINDGIFLHTLMARVKTRDDVAPVIADAVASGLIRNDEQEEIMHTIAWIISHPSLHDAFDASAVIRTESLVILPDGSERRIDRLATQNDRTWVIDYKTGTPKPADKSQVKEYQELLKTMGFKNVETWLVYAAERRLSRVD